MNTCKTCKFWGKRGHWERPYAHLCKHPKMAGDKASMDGVNDFELCGEGIATGPDFGCIHHKSVGER